MAIKLNSKYSIDKVDSANIALIENKTGTHCGYYWRHVDALVAWVELELRECTQTVKAVEKKRHDLMTLINSKDLLKRIYNEKFVLELKKEVKK